MISAGLMLNFFIPSKDAAGFPPPPTPHWGDCLRFLCHYVDNIQQLHIVYDKSHVPDWAWVNVKPKPSLLLTNKNYSDRSKAKTKDIFWWLSARRNGKLLLCTNRQHLNDFGSRILFHSATRISENLFYCLINTYTEARNSLHRYTLTAEVILAIKS